LVRATTEATRPAAEALKLLEDMGLAEQFARDAVQLAR
jgi:hypothetical protein